MPQESVDIVRKSILSTKVGNEGYVFVLGGKGSEKGKYIISAGGQRDGEVILEAKDANGHLFIKEMVEKAVTLQPGEITEQLYPWSNEAGSPPVYKLSRVMYYEPWDWVIGAGTSLDDLFQAREGLEQLEQQTAGLMIGFFAFFVLMAIGVWSVMANQLSKNLMQIVNQVVEVSDQLFHFSSEISEA
ncbi:Cache 3/Cache 2 fusion domain-containing protein, partial [Arthrospira platensis SPKY1]|nr:Cache 3/Cache 2 fusion domain-containing protein [Arthrospira platensis SPKY1]